MAAAATSPDLPRAVLWRVARIWRHGGGGGYRRRDGLLHGRSRAVAGTTEAAHILLDVVMSSAALCSRLTTRSTSIMGGDPLIPTLLASADGARSAAMSRPIMFLKRAMAHQARLRVGSPGRYGSVGSRRCAGEPRATPRPQQLVHGAHRSYEML